MPSSEQSLDAGSIKMNWFLSIVVADRNLDIIQDFMLFSFGKYCNDRSKKKAENSVSEVQYAGKDSTTYFHLFIFTFKINLIQFFIVQACVHSLARFQKFNMNEYTPPNTKSAFFKCKPDLAR